MAVGMTFVLISGEVDLSVGSTYALSGLATGMLIIAGWALLPALAVGLLTGMAIGLINGLLSTYGRLPSLIATLGMLQHRARRRADPDQRPAGHRQRAQRRAPEVLEAFTLMGQGYLFGIVPMQLVFFVIIAAVAWVVLSYTNFGFRVFAVGGSAKAARVSGISVNTVKIWAFVLMGLLAAFAGILEPRLPAERPGRAAPASGSSSTSSPRPSSAAPRCRAAKAPSSAQFSAC